jgi:hypothetical protein
METIKAKTGLAATTGHWLIDTIAWYAVSGLEQGFILPSTQETISKIVGSLCKNLKTMNEKQAIAAVLAEADDSEFWKMHLRNAIVIASRKGILPAEMQNSDLVLDLDRQEEDATEKSNTLF